MENGQLSILVESQNNSFIPTLLNLSDIIEKSADDGNQISVADIGTVENIDKLLVASHGLSRSCLYWMRQKKGYLVLNFESFEEYGNARFGFSRQHLNRLTDAYLIQSIIEPSSQKDIKESVLRVLKDVPDDVKKQIWDELKLKNDGKSQKITAKMVDEQVAVYKRENEMLQKKLDDANHKLSSVQTIDVETIIEKTTREVESDMQRKIDDVTDQLWKSKKEKEKLEQELKGKSSSDSEETTLRLAEIEKEIKAKQNQLEQFNFRLESDYTDLHVNENVTAICQALRDKISFAVSELAPLKNAAKTVYETTNSEIYGTADLLEECAKTLRMFATDYADFSMSSTTIQ